MQLRVIGYLLRITVLKSPKNTSNAAQYVSKHFRYLRCHPGFHADTSR